MAQIFLYGLHIVTGFQGNNCVRVAKIVEADPLHPKLCHNDFECPVQCLGCDPVSNFVRKDQIVFLKCFTEFFPVLVLRPLGFPQQIHDERCCGDGTLLAVFCREKSMLLIITPHLSTEAL